MATKKTPLMPDIFSTENRVTFDGGHVDVFRGDEPTKSSEKKPPAPRRKKPAAKKAARKKK